MIAPECDPWSWPEPGALLRDTSPDVWTQRHTASLRRRDGHTIDGIPGDCFRTALAYLLGSRPDHVPHFALYLNWWDETRRWLREHDGRDLYYVDAEHPEHWGLIPGEVDDDALVLLGGPSPRGSFGHVCVGHRDGTVLWDPHPSRAGLLDVAEFFVLGPPYYLLQPRLQLETAQPSTSCTRSSGTERTYCSPGATVYVHDARHPSSRRVQPSHQPVYQRPSSWRTRTCRGSGKRRVRSSGTAATVGAW